eukprot:391338_1
MFHRNYIAIKSLLNVGLNNITIVFYSKVKWAEEEANSCNATTDEVCPYQCKPWAQPYGWCNINFIRTTSLSFGWDWGPLAASVGIWKSIYIQAYNSAVIRDWLVYTIPYKKDYTKWDLMFVAFVDAGQTNVLYPAIDKPNSKASINGIVRVVVSELNINKSVNITLNQFEEVNISINIGVINNPELWWPNEYGVQKLYSAQINFIATNNQMDEGHKRDFGFKEIQLMQPIAPGNKGNLFYFQINNVTIPVHGTNWIPMDQFQDQRRINASFMQTLFDALNTSHQNMIRVNGVGIYEHDYFYELCDKYGILIWHDMMWCDAAYWMPSSFVKSSTKEVIDQVRRIQKHPSIAIWSG